MEQIKLKGRKPKKQVNVDLGDKKYTYRELAEKIGVTTQAIRLMIADGRISKNNLKPAKTGARIKRDVSKLEKGELYSKKEAREKLKIAPQTLDRMIKDGDLTLVIISNVEFVKNGRK